MTQVIGSGISLVGRSPWTAADALVRLLAGRPGGRPRARAPVPHSSPERGLPESSTYPVSTIKDRAALASDRAAAIEALMKARSLNQRQIAKLTGFSDSLISQLRKCSKRLSRAAKQLLDENKMNLDAAASLASAKNINMDGALKRAQELAQERDDRHERGKQETTRIPAKGRITIDEINRAIRSFEA